MSNEYAEHFKDEEARKLKQDFLDYIIGVQDALEQAERYGAAGDARMLDIIAGFRNLQQDVVAEAKFTNEEIPPEDYTEKVWHIVRDYFSKVISGEILRIQNGMQPEGETSYWSSEIENLNGRIEYFKNWFPELEVVSTDSAFKKEEKLID